jgi:hypothetical protein
VYVLALLERFIGRVARGKPLVGLREGIVGGESYGPHQLQGRQPTVEHIRQVLLHEHSQRTECLCREMGRIVCCSADSKA